MKKKFVSIVLAALMMASLTTGCGDKETAKKDTPSSQTAEVNTETEAEGEAEPGEDSAPEGFTLLDVSADMIQTGIYAVSEDGTELVFSMFTEPSGTPMASLFVFTSDGSGDVICGTYSGESETDEDGIAWSLLTVSDVYTGSEVGIGFGELGEAVYILDSETAYEGQYLSADETIVYMGMAAALMQ